MVSSGTQRVQGRNQLSQKWHIRLHSHQTERVKAMVQLRKGWRTTWMQRGELITLRVSKDSTSSSQSLTKRYYHSLNILLDLAWKRRVRKNLRCSRIWSSKTLIAGTVWMDFHPGKTISSTSTTSTPGLTSRSLRADQQEAPDHHIVLRAAEPRIPTSVSVYSHRRNMLRTSLAVRTHLEQTRIRRHRKSTKWRKYWTKDLEIMWDVFSAVQLLAHLNRMRIAIGAVIQSKLSRSHSLASRSQCTTIGHLQLSLSGASKWRTCLRFSAMIVSMRRAPMKTIKTINYR